MFHYLTATPWHFEENLVYEILIENSTNNSIMKLLQKTACYQLRKMTPLVFGKVKVHIHAPVAFEITKEDASR